MGEKEEVEIACLLEDTRLVFIELLRAAYTAQIKDGELDPREYNGFLVFNLFQGLDFAHDAVSSGNSSLCDWKSSQIGSAELVEKTTFFADRLYRCCCANIIAPEERAFRNTEPLEYQRLRIKVFRVLSFIEAHQEAQARLVDEFGNGTSQTAAAFRTVT